MTKKKQEVKPEPKVTRPRSSKVVIDSKATLAAESKPVKTKPARPTCPICNGPTVSRHLDKGKLREIVLCDTQTCINYRKYIKGI